MNFYKTDFKNFFLAQLCFIQISLKLSVINSTFRLFLITFWTPCYFIKGSMGEGWASSFVYPQMKIRSMYWAQLSCQFSAYL